MRKNRRTLLASAAATFLLAFVSPSHAASCEDLANLKLPDTVIKSAEMIAAGTFVGPDKANTVQTCPPSAG